MNNILFCNELIISGTGVDISGPAQLGFYDLTSYEFTDNLVGKDFGIHGTTFDIAGNHGAVNIADVHLLNIVKAELPLNVTYSISIDGADLEKDPEKDVELIIIHRNADTTKPWRHFITIPYADFNGDTAELKTAIYNKITELVDAGNLNTSAVTYENDSDPIVLQFSNDEQYLITTKSEYLEITGPTNYKPVTRNKIATLIDKNMHSFGINHREYDDYIFNAIISKVVNTYEFDTVVSIQYTNIRKSGVTHDEPILRVLHIVTTSENADSILSIFTEEQSSTFTPIEQNQAN